MNLLLTIITDSVWNQFVAWFKIRGLTPPPRAERGIFVITEKGDLVSGCCLYTTDGPWFLAEDACADPLMPARLVHMAACITVEQIRNYAAMTGKRALCLPSTQGLLGILKGAGFVEIEAVPVGSSPIAFTGVGFTLDQTDTAQPPEVPVQRKRIQKRRVKKDEINF